jgi:hypothetical protein
MAAATSSFLENLQQRVLNRHKYVAAATRETSEEEEGGGDNKVETDLRRLLRACETVLRSETERENGHESKVALLCRELAAVLSLRLDGNEHKRPVDDAAFDLHKHDACAHLAVYAKQAAIKVVYSKRIKPGATPLHSVTCDIHSPFGSARSRSAGLSWDTAQQQAAENMCHLMNVPLDTTVPRAEP